MPFDLSSEIDPAKLTALAAIYASGAKPRVGEIVKVDWAGESGTLYYAATDYNVITGFSGLSAYGIDELEIRFAKDGAAAVFLDIPRTSDIADEKVQLDFVDHDERIVTLYRDNYGEGTRVTVLAWFPEVDLLTEIFWGHFEAPNEMDGYRFKIPASTGFRSPNLNLPRRTRYPGCQALYGAHVRADGTFLFPTLESLEDNDCPVNVHLGGDIGASGFTACSRNSVAVCDAHIPDQGVRRSYLAFDFQAGISSVGGGKHKWTATTRGNDENRSKAVRVIAGTVRVRDLDLEAYQSQSGGSKPENGYAVTLWSVCEGPIVAQYDHHVNDQYIALNHLIVNTGQLRQPPIPFPTQVLNYSGTAMARLDAGPKDWRNTTSSDLKGECTVVGLNNVRVYSDAETFTRQYTTNRSWWLLNMYTNRRWGYGYDFSRIIPQDWIDLAEWCDETVTTTDVDGETPISATRSTFNADLNENTLQNQITQVCLGGRIALPFNYNGKLRVVPLTAEDISSAPIFTDQGSSPNIVYENNRSTLRWSKKSDKEIVNKLVVTFDNAANDWQAERIVCEDQDQQLLAGIAAGDRTLRIVEKSVQAFGITNYGEAVRWSKLLLNLGEFDGFEKPGIKNNLRVKFTTWYPLVAALKLYPNKIIKVINPQLQQQAETPSVAFTAFRIMKLTRGKDLKMTIEAQAYPADYYANIEDEVFVGSPPTNNPGGRYVARPRPVRVIAGTRTLDYITVTTEEEE